jgi:hypothetical protein
MVILFLAIQKTGPKFSATLDNFVWFFNCLVLECLIPAEIDNPGIQILTVSSFSQVKSSFRCSLNLGNLFLQIENDHHFYIFTVLKTANVGSHNLSQGGVKECNNNGLREYKTVLVLFSGGTESILLACKAYRDWAREVKGISNPVIVSFNQSQIDIDGSFHIKTIRPFPPPLTHLR